jgi:hypothetical protein
MPYADGEENSRMRPGKHLQVMEMPEMKNLPD